MKLGKLLWHPLKYRSIGLRSNHFSCFSVLWGGGEGGSALSICSLHYSWAFNRCGQMEANRRYAQRVWQNLTRVISRTCGKNVLHTYADGIMCHCMRTCLFICFKAAPTNVQYNRSKCGPGIACIHFTSIGIVRRQ